MGSSYYITFGTDRVTYPGVSGCVAWEYAPPTGYYERLLWSGNIAAKNATAGLSVHPSGFDAIRVECGGGNQIGNSLLYNTYQFPYHTLSATNRIFMESPMFGSTASDGVTRGWMFGGIMTNCNTTAWTLASAWGREFNSNRVEYRYDLFQVRKIWGIHYG